jgi:hypothetical protein
MTSQLLKSLICQRFCSPEWATFLEVASGTGSNARRFADAVSMNLYPSRGLEIQGFEVKVSRNDWLNELKNPSKAEEIAQYCDRWWVVTPEGIIRDGELPPTWGHFIVRNGKLCCATKAPQLTAKQITREFVAALIRRAGEHDQHLFNQAVEAHTKQIQEQANARAKSQIAMATEHYNRLAKRVQEIKDLTGIDINTWKPSYDIANAIKLVMTLGVTDTYSHLDTLVKAIEVSNKQLSKAVELIDQFKTRPRGRLRK